MSGGMSCESRELPSHEHFHRNLKEKSELPQSHTPQYSAAFLYGQTSGLLLYIYERRQTCRNGILLPDVYHHHFVFSGLYGANLPRSGLFCEYVIFTYFSRLSVDFPADYCSSGTYRNAALPSKNAVLPTSSCLE